VRSVDCWERHAKGWRRILQHRVAVCTSSPPTRASHLSPCAPAIYRLPVPRQLSHKPPDQGALLARSLPRSQTGVADCASEQHQRGAHVATVSSMSDAIRIVRLVFSPGHASSRRPRSSPARPASARARLPLRRAAGDLQERRARVAPPAWSCGTRMAAKDHPD
jgi:hypothetical protein